MTLSRRQLLRFGMAVGLAGPPALGPRRAPRAQASSPSSPIVIGHQAPLTGAVETFGRWHNRALQAAVARINEAGGVAGRRLELATEDSASTPEAGIDAFRRLVLDRGASVVVGSVWSGTNIATAPLARELGTLYIPQGIATEIVGSAGNRYVLKSYHTVRAAVRSGVEWAMANLGRRWTILASQLAFAQSQSRDWQAQIAANGGEVVDVIDVPFRPSDFVPFVSRIDPGRTDAVFQAFTAVDTIRFLQTARQLGLQRELPLLGLIEGIDVLPTTDPAFEGTHYISSYPRRAGDVPDDLAAYDAAYRQAIGIGPDGRATDSAEVVPIADLFGSWQALSLVASAMEAIDWRRRSDTPKLVRALEGRTYEAGPAFPQGNGRIRAEDHLAFHGHYLERVQDDGTLRVVTRLPEAHSRYEPLADFTDEPFA